MIGRIYVGAHLMLLHTKYLSSGPYEFQQRRFLIFFSHYKSMGANEPRGLANLDPRGMTGKIYIGDHLTLLHTNYLSSRPYGFREEDFSHYKSTGAIYCHGNQNSNPISMVHFNENRTHYTSNNLSLHILHTWIYDSSFSRCRG